MGCILYELALNLLGATNAVLLPASATRGDDDGDDQLVLILKLLGSPSEEDKAFLTDCPLRDYAVETLKSGVPRPIHRKTCRPSFWRSLTLR